MNVWSLAQRLCMAIFRSSLELIGWLLGLAYQASSWIAHRAFRGARLAPKLGRFIVCPRGHRSAADGYYDCGCGARFSGWIWQRCPSCGTRPGHVPCPRCGLVIVNPVVR